MVNTFVDNTAALPEGEFVIMSSEYEAADIEFVILVFWEVGGSLNCSPILE